MNTRTVLCRLGWIALAILLMGGMPYAALAQEADSDAQDEEQQDEAAETPTVEEQIVVTGSRILSSPLTERAPLVELTTEDLQRSGLTNLGDKLQQLPSMGTAINSSFNVPGNSGFPQDGNGIGAGAVQLSLRDLGAKRTLVLVDGKRWIAGASASGVPIAVDLNTLPAAAIERIEVLQDGASAIYGSDAIGGVVNIIMKKDFKGMHIAVQNGEYASEGDGQATEISGVWGGGGDGTHLVISGSFFEEQGVTTTDRAQSAFPNPFATSCDVPGTLCSSFTPQGRFILGPNFDFASITLNDGVLNDGGANIPVFNPSNPGSGDFHNFTSADRFNYNGQDFNYLQTPNERVNLFASLVHELTENSRFTLKGAYTNRQSDTRAAPEPLCLGNGCGNRIAESIFIHRDQQYNPFGVDLSVANGNLEFFGRRPLESGPRIFVQDVNSYLGTVGFEGWFTAGGDKNYFWDVSATYGDNRAFQQKFGSHDIAKIQVALGDPAVCAATPNCVPLNFFGGQGPDGSGSITQEMLNYIGYTQRDFSEQTLFDVSGNITGDLFETSLGTVSFAAGAEYREQEGSFQPDPIAARGETAGIPSAPTAGEFDVTEFYAEVNVPLAFENGIDYLELNAAARYSDYSTFGGEGTYKFGVLLRPIQQLSLRGSISTGLRAPGIGELFGGAAREDFTYLDPCADVLGQIGSANGGRDAPQPPNIIANCAALGVPVNFAQRNPQISAISAGNRTLIPETSDSLSFGFVYSPKRTSSSGWSVSADFYDVEIEDAIQGRDPGDVVDACVNTLDPFFCDAVERASSGLINLVDNQLQNIGAVEASGADFVFKWRSKDSNIGVFDLAFSATYLDEFVERTANPDGSLTTTDRTGTITNETFQRAFPEWKALTTLDWRRDRLGGSLAVRWVDDMIQDNGDNLDSRYFTDVQFRYRPPVPGDSLAFVLGVNNVFDEDPAVCEACGVIGMAPIVHDLPGTLVFLRLEWAMIRN